MISSQCTKRRTSVNSCVFVIMIVAKILLLFPPLLLLASAQGGGRPGFFGRPDFRRPRPWDRPTVPPVPDTPMPTERVTEHITEPPKTRTELTTITSVRSTSPPVSSVSRFSQHGRVWARPVFGPRSTVYTPAPITPTESITVKAEDYSPKTSVPSSTKESNGYMVTPPTRVPFVDNHVKYNEPNNYSPKGRYSLPLTHNAEEIQPDSIKTTTELPLTTEKVTEIATEKITTPTETHSPMVSSTSTTTESVTSTVAPITEAPFINSHTKDVSLNNNLGTRSPQTSNEQTTELRTTAEPLTTPRVSIVSTRTTNFNSRSRFPPYMSHNLNLPPIEVPPHSIPADYFKASTTTVAPTTVAPTTENPSSTTESAGYTVDSSTNAPFVDEHKKFDDIYLTPKTPIPFKIISTTEVASSTTNHHDPIYQVNPNNENIITSESKPPITTTPKAVVTSKAPEEYITPATTKVSFIDVRKEINVGFTSQPPVEYTNGYEKTSEVPSKSDDYNAPVYPVYNHGTEKVNYYDQSSLASRLPERYIITTTTKLPFTDMHKFYDIGFTSAPPVEYTNGYDKAAKIPSNSDDSDEFIQNIYRNNNHHDNNYEKSTPKMVTTTQTALPQYRRPKTTTEQAVLTTQTSRHTNSYRYTDPTTKPTTRYTTPTLRSSRVNKVLDIDNFQCKDEDGYYSISNQCDDFIECKSGFPIQNTCPDGLHFNPAAKYSEFPCAYPSEVKCESNAVIRQAEPTSECPRRYGYFNIQDGSCDKYVMCQEGQATIMSCPPGLAFNVATSSCDWPANVPDCLPDVFQGFTCPAPELNDDGQPTHSIYKYRYDKSCKKYIACQKGHPRLLSCDSGLAFDENSESCIDEFDVTDCT